MSRTEINKAKPIPTNSKAIYGSGEFRLKTNGSVAGIQINYSGMVRITYELPNGWFIRAGENKIIIFGLTTADLPETLFKYTGEFRVKTVHLVDWHLNKTYTTIINPTLDYWNNMNEKWEDISEEYKKLAKTYTIGKPPTKTRVFKKIKGATK